MSLVYEGDNWQTGQHILEETVLSELKTFLESTPLIIEHWFYRGSSAPDRFVVDNYDDLKEHLEKHSKPGDAFYIWRFDLMCKEENTILQAKYPDEQGRVPKGGAY